MMGYLEAQGPKGIKRVDNRGWSGVHIGGVRIAKFKRGQKKIFYETMKKKIVIYCKERVVTGGPGCLGGGGDRGGWKKERR
jgi:hypothetical protein